MRNNIRTFLLHQFFSICHANTREISKLVHRLWIENERVFELTDAGRLDVCQIDAAAADAIIQYALFDDIIYG